MLRLEHPHEHDQAELSNYPGRLVAMPTSFKYLCSKLRFSLDSATSNCLTVRALDERASYGWDGAI